jgi:hypothetical protein
MWRRRLRRILVGVLAVTMVVAALYLAVKPVRVAVLTMALVPELLESAPRPLSAVTADPRRISVTYGGPGPDRMDLYLPTTSPVELGSLDRYPTLMLVLGVSPLPLEDERVVRLATAVARLGFVVAAPESSEMRQRRILPEERDRLISAFEVVAARPEVDPDRIGMAGFSVGAGIALLAAADPRIADRVRYVNAFGSYGDAPALLVELATRSMVVDGERRPWRPGDLSREVFLQLVLELVDEAGVREQIRRRIEPVILGNGPTIESYDPEFAETLEGDARAVYRLVTTTYPSVGEAAIASLSLETRTRLARLSPNLWADGLRARIYLMHDEGDTVIPFAQLEPLVEAIPPDRVARVTDFRFFDHVAPGGLEPAALPELWALFGHLWAVTGEAL